MSASQQKSLPLVEGSGYEAEPRFEQWLKVHYEMEQLRLHPHLTMFTSRSLSHERWKTWRPDLGHILQGQQ